MAGEDAPLSHVIEDLDGSGRNEAVSVGELLQTFEHRSLGVLLTVFGLIASLPVIGGIPGMSILTGTLILIAVGQAALGGGSLWMPAFVRRREISREKVKKAVEKSRPWVERVDHLLKPRLGALVDRRAQHAIIAIAAALLALTFYPLAIVPWGVTAPALGVLALGLGLMACDGLFVLIGYACAAVTAYLLYTTL